MRQRNIEFRYSSGFLRVQYLQLFKLLLHWFFASTLRKWEKEKEKNIS